MQYQYEVKLTALAKSAPVFLWFYTCILSYLTTLVGMYCCDSNLLANLGNDYVHVNTTLLDYLWSKFVLIYRQDMLSLQIIVITMKWDIILGITLGTSPIKCMRYHFDRYSRTELIDSLLALAFVLRELSGPLAHNTARNARATEYLSSRIYTNDSNLNLGSNFTLSRYLW